MPSFLSDGIEIAYDIYGEGRPILLIHGFASSGIINWVNTGWVETLQRAGWIADYVDPNTFLELWETDNGNNDTNWSNPDYDRLLHASLAAKTTEERYAIYQQLDAMLVDEVPVIPIYYYTTVRTLNPKIQGYHPTLIDNHPWKYFWREQ